MPAALRQNGKRVWRYFGCSGPGERLGWNLGVGVRLAFLLVLVMACGRQPAAAQYQCVLAPSGIVGFWPGDGYPNDLVGGNNAVLESNATVTATGMVGS